MIRNFFWKSIKGLLNNCNNQLSSNIDGEGWANYFKNLLNNKVNNLPFNDYIKESLNVIENIPSIDGHMSHVNSNIESDEIIMSVKGLKNGKACGVDSITNDMLKSGIDVI